MSWKPEGTELVRVTSALRSALSDKLKHGGVKIVDSFELADHKTKNFVKVMETLKQDDRILVVDKRENLNLQRASSNLPKVKFCAPLALNIHDLLKYENMVVSRDALLEIQEVLNK